MNNPVNFLTALKFALQAEGGFVDNPSDPGGATNYGITQEVYDNFRTAQSLPVQSVKNISMDEVDDIYAKNYWMAGNCDEMPLTLAVAHFDACVNCGIPQAVKFIQQILGLTVDGEYGPMTASAVETSKNLVDGILLARRGFYTALAQEKPSMQQFLKGWLKRVENLQDYIEALNG